jgi:hypothetical protein
MVIAPCAEACVAAFPAAGMRRVHLSCAPLMVAIRAHCAADSVPTRSSERQRCEALAIAAHLARTREIGIARGSGLADGSAAIAIERAIQTGREVTSAAVTVAGYVASAIVRAESLTRFTETKCSATHWGSVGSCTTDGVRELRGWTTLDGGLARLTRRQSTLEHRITNDGQGSGIADARRANRCQTTSSRIGLVNV